MTRRPDALAPILPGGLQSALHGGADVHGWGDYRTNLKREPVMSPFVLSGRSLGPVRLVG